MYHPSILLATYIIDDDVDDNEDDNPENFIRLRLTSLVMSQLIGLVAMVERVGIAGLRRVVVTAAAYAPVDLFHSEAQTTLESNDDDDKDDNDYEDEDEDDNDYEDEDKTGWEAVFRDVHNDYAVKLTEAQAAELDATDEIAADRQQEIEVLLPEVDPDTPDQLPREPAIRWLSCAESNGCGRQSTTITLSTLKKFLADRQPIALSAYQYPPYEIRATEVVAS